jgi:hypothetical protein
LLVPSVLALSIQEGISMGVMNCLALRPSMKKKMIKKIVMKYLTDIHALTVKMKAMQCRDGKEKLTESEAKDSSDWKDSECKQQDKY